MKQKLLFCAAAICLAALAAGAVYEYRRQQAEARILTGTVEVTKADIAPKVSGYIAALYVKEGDAVTKGDTAADETSLANLRKLENGSRAEEIAQARNETAAARAESVRADRDYARMVTLLAEGAVSRQDYDASVEARDAAAARLRAARDYQALLENGTREEDLSAARHTVAQNEAVMNISAQSVKDLSVPVPLSGVILTKNYEPGEYVNAGASIATVADLSDCWVKVYVSPEELGRLRLGQCADVSIDGAPNQVRPGRIKEIKDSAEYTPRQSITRNERANLVFAVKVAVSNEDGIMKPGMPADVIFHE